MLGLLSSFHVTSGSFHPRVVLHSAPKRFSGRKLFSRYQRLSHLALLSSMLTRSTPSPVVGAVDVVKPSEKRVVVGPIDRVDGDPRGLR